MTRTEFVNFLKNHDIPYREYDTIKGYDGIRIMHKEEWNLKQNYPRKYRTFIVSNITVSDFDNNDSWCVKEEGRNLYLPQEDVLEKVKILGGVM